jgi:hypothetical protein
MRRWLLTRFVLAIGVMVCIAWPLSSVASAARRHHHHPAPVTSSSGPQAHVVGDLTETSVVGGVGFVFEGSGWYANEPISIASPGLLADCAGPVPGEINNGSGADGNPLVVTTDFSGAFNVAVAGQGCTPGTYQVTGEEVNTPNRVATANAVITAPALLSPAVALSPASEVETGTSGHVEGTILIQGLNPQEFLEIGAPSLAAACPGSAGGPVNFIQDLNTLTISGSLAAYGAIPPTAAANPKTDYAGNDIVVFSAAGCNAGAYPVVTTETGAGHRSFNDVFTVVAP